MSGQHEDFLAATLPALDHVYNLARRLSRDVDQVQDIVQETYVKAFEAWIDGRRPRKVDPWITTICLNVGRSLWRRASNQREVVTAPDPTVEADLDVAEEAMRALQAGVVHDALWSLSEQQRIAIVLMDLNGFTASEVATMTRTPRGTVLSRVHRGRKKLAELLGSQVVVRDT
ncbi:MAG: RNA polymerase sigma factor [Actinomycetota bacterium]